LGILVTSKTVCKNIGIFLRYVKEVTNTEILYYGLGTNENIGIFLTDRGSVFRFILLFHIEIISPRACCYSIFFIPDTKILVFKHNFWFSFGNI